MVKCLLKGKILICRGNNQKAQETPISQCFLYLFLKEEAKLQLQTHLKKTRSSPFELEWLIVDQPWPVHGIGTDSWTSWKYEAVVETCILETIQDFLIKLGIKPLIYLLKISIFSLNNDIVRLTKIMNNLVKDIKILNFKVIFNCLKLVESFKKIFSVKNIWWGDQLLLMKIFENFDF